MDDLLTVDRLSGGYGDKIVIKGVSITAKSGDFLGIIGPNGSGKSTLLRIITLILRAKEGGVYLSGIDIRSVPRKELFKKMAFVPQETLINFPFRVCDIVMMGRIPHLNRFEREGGPDSAAVERALELTETAHLAERLINELSAGERQRVIIARALAQEPAILFLDEPTSHLDIGHQIQIMDMLKKLNKERALAIIIVLHDLNLASEYCDKIILLDAGKVFGEGAPDEVLTYQNIEAVYKTVVLVGKNSVTSRPSISLVPGGSLCRPD